MNAPWTSPHSTASLIDPPSAEPASPSSPPIHRNLYTSHTLSTLNTRIFEFGAILYLASIYPHTLLPVSIYGLIRGLSAVFFAPAVGRLVDTSNRLKVVRASILGGRGAGVASCGCFNLLLQSKSNGEGGVWGVVLLGLLVPLACIEKLCAVMNLVAVERDWVVVVAEKNEDVLRLLNSRMRRIDLVCKLLGPFAISILDGFSTRLAILGNLGMGVVSVGVEYYAIANVYYNVEGLREEKHQDVGSCGRSTSSLRRRLLDTLSRQTKELLWYVHHPAFRASFAGCSLYLTVLSFSGQMTTYLLSTGYNSFHIAITRTVSITLEIAATFLAPWAMSRIGPIRSGIWFINWQMLCLLGAVTSFWLATTPLLAATGLVVGTILSRIGLWGFDLSTQVIVQEEVDAEHRGSFSSIEASAQNLFELCSYAMTVVASRPSQFRWPVLGSMLAVYAAGILYASFVRRRRGHLVHLSKCIEGGKGAKGRTGELGEYVRLENMGH